MRQFVDLAVRRRVSVVMVALSVAAFGYVGYSRLPLELFPDISYPALTVQTDFPDTAPQEVENLVTRPVEEAVGVLSGLHTIHSISRSGTSEVTLEFEWGSDMNTLSMELRNKLDRVLLPEEAEDPIVLRYDPSLDPILRIALTGGKDLAALRVFAERSLKQEFEQLHGVASAQIKGGLEEEIHVEVQQERLAALGIPLERLREVLSVSNVNLPGGMLRGRDNQFLVRTMNEFASVEEIAELIILQNEGASIRLREVADVRMGSKEREEITRVNGAECVELSVYKEGDANTVTVARAVHRLLDDLRTRKLSNDQSLVVLFDQSSFIQQALNGVRDAALIGGSLAIVILFIFLRDLRVTLIVGLSIPMSVVATFLVMYRAKISLNIMSLGGLTLGIGMLVDNSIVVLESIFRKRQSARSLLEAAVEGTTEVGPAVAASTLTTVAVFLPIVFVEGIAGQLFKDQALTVTISLLASLIIAITMIPMLSAIGKQPTGKRRPSNAPTKRSDATHTLGPLSRAYGTLLGLALRWRWVTLLTSLFLFVSSIYSIGWLGTELIPPLSEGEFLFEVNMPEGTPLASTDRTVTTMESAARAEPDVERTYTIVGSRLVAGGMSLNTRGENLGQINVVLKNRNDAQAEEAVVGRLREQYATIYDHESKFGRPSYFSLKTPIEVIVFGEVLEDLRTYSIELAEALAEVPGLVDVRSSLEAGNPELQVIPNRRRLASLGVDLGTFAQTLQNRVLGVVPTRFRKGDRLIDIRLRNLEETRSSIQDVENLVIAGPTAPLRLQTVADVKLTRGPAEIHRLQQQRAAVVTANLKGTTLGLAIGAVESKLAERPPPRGMTTDLGGQSREMEISFNSLRFALILAVFLVYLVMASIFESFLHPLIVLFTVPLTLVGVVAGLLATKTTVTVIVLIGSVMLVGIVVNNSIVLIDAINRLRAAGVDKRAAVVEAGHLRLRPIIMTTLTTVLGLLPMAFSGGEGAELRAPLAITVAAGLTFSTLLTLIVIPAAYDVVPSRPPAAILGVGPLKGGDEDTEGAPPPGTTSGAAPEVAS